MSTCFELPLTPNYVRDWNFGMAVRELIQNGLDQQSVDAKSTFSIEYDPDTQKLKFTNARSRLKVNTLLLGRSSKSNDQDTVGQFGEGYKIAALVLNRLGKTFTIYNNMMNQVWTSKFKNSRKWLDKLLAFYVEDVQSTNDSLVIEVGNVTQEEYDQLTEIWLSDPSVARIRTEYGDILTEPEYSGKFFVNGLYIECSGDFSFGYDFKPRYMVLERDRKSCDSWSARQVTCKMITSALLSGELDFDTAKELIEVDADDINLIDYTYIEGSGKERLVENLEKSFEEQHPSESRSSSVYVPVNSEIDKERVNAYGGIPVIVPHNVANLLSNYKEERIRKLKDSYSGDETLTVKERFQKWYDLYSRQLNPEAKEELSKLINML